MSKNSEKVKRWRKSTKQMMVDSMGGKCVCCGYNNCNNALELHHLNRSLKTLSFGSIIAKPTKWNLIVEELRKCVLVCSNCHKEIEAGVLSLPEKFPVFNESFADKKASAQPNQDRKCLTCDIPLNTFHKQQRYCSLKCRPVYPRYDSRKVKNRPTKEKLAELMQTTSMVKIGKMFGVSDNSIRKWAKQYQLL